jgi:L-histidine Nalpha-methyltransferase
VNAPFYPELKSPQFIQLYHEDTQAIAQELTQGLLATSAYTSPKYLYDSLGSRLFEAITELPEYYPTRTEASLFATYAQQMAQAVGPDCTLIDLGAGNCEKAAKLFAAFSPTQYVPVDISVEFLRDSVESLQRQFPTLDMLGVGMDFSQSFDLPESVRGERRVFFYPGSSIGNFTPEEAQTFLHRLRSSGHAQGLLIGVDMVKPTEVLEPAYDDALGVTAAFNKNLLLHINQLLGANFDLNQWKHIGLFNHALSRIEMHLESTSDQTLRWNLGSRVHERHFKRGERIHTENSYKYTPQRFTELLQSAGFGQVQHWTDDKAWFSVFYASA